MRAGLVGPSSAPIDIPKQSAPRACSPGHVSASATPQDFTAVEPTPEARRLERHVKFAELVDIRIIPARSPQVAPPTVEPPVVSIDTIQPSLLERLADVGVAVCVLGVVGTIPLAFVVAPAWAAMPCGFVVGLVLCNLLGSRPMFERTDGQDYIGP